LICVFTILSLFFFMNEYATRGSDTSRSLPTKSGYVDVSLQTSNNRELFLTYCSFTYPCSKILPRFLPRSCKNYKVLQDLAIFSKSCWILARILQDSFQESLMQDFKNLARSWHEFCNTLGKFFQERCTFSVQCSVVPDFWTIY
jgi:hypothetical protein